MTITSLKWIQKATATREVLASNDVRTLIANHLGVDVKRVTDEAHFTDDLGADWLDRLELMIVIEDQFADVLVTDEEVDQLEVVGDLIRHIENVDHERRRRSIVEATPLQQSAFIATFSARRGRRRATEGREEVGMRRRPAAYNGRRHE
jgi:acyl carrier protein